MPLVYGKQIITHRKWRIWEREISTLEHFWGSGWIWSHGLWRYYLRCFDLLPACCGCGHCYSWLLCQHCQRCLILFPGPLVRDVCKGVLPLPHLANYFILLLLRCVLHIFWHQPLRGSDNLFPVNPIFFTDFHFFFYVNVIS